MLHVEYFDAFAYYLWFYIHVYVNTCIYTWNLTWSKNAAIITQPEIQTSEKADRGRAA